MNKSIHFGTTNIYHLIYACRYGLCELVKYLVEHGADIHIQDDYPLRSASENGKFDVVKYLVEHDADIHAEYDDALIVACQHGYIHIVKYLVENGADVHANNDDALRWASMCGHMDIVKYFHSYLLVSNFLLKNKRKKPSVLSNLVMAVVYKNRFFKTISY